MKGITCASGDPTLNIDNSESIRLVPESVLGLRLLKSGYVAQYEAGKGFLVREASPAKRSRATTST
jgi:hypothetical protein